MYRKLQKYIEPFIGKFILSLFCMAGVAGLTALIRLIVKPLIDKVFVAKDVKILYMIVVSLPLIYLFLGILNYIKNYLMVSISQGITLAIRNKMYEHLQNLSVSFYSKGSTGNLMSRLTNDIALLQFALGKVPVTIVCDGLTVIGLIGVLFYLHWKFAIISLTIFPLASIPIINFSRRIRKLSITSQKQMSELYEHLQETISAINITKAFNQEKNEIERFRVTNNKYYELMLRFTKTESLSSPVVELMGATAMALILFFAANDVLQGYWSTGSFFAFFAAAFSVYQPLRNFVQLNPHIQQGLAAADRIFMLLEEKPQVEESKSAAILPPFNKQIKYENITFKYETNAEPVLKNINITINAGESIAIVGISGSGKSTLSHLLMRFYDPVEGRLTIDGYDLCDVSLSSLRNQVGVVTQDTILFNETIGYNIGYGKKGSTESEIIESAKLANAHDFIMNLPQKYETIVGERGVLVSGGERQRIAIARAIIKNPRILLLDEATSALDAESERLVQDALDRLTENKTVIMIAHRLSTIKKCDRIVVIDKGMIVETGTHEELFKNNGIYKRLHQLQLI